MRRMFLLPAAGSLLLLLLPAIPAQATPVFDTIGPTGVTTGGSGVFVGTTGGILYERAASFTVAGPDDFAATEVDVLMDDGGNEIRLWTDAGGAPGILLDSAAPPATSVLNDLYTVTLGGGAVLEAGETYWISVFRATGSSAWRYASSGPYAFGARMNRENGGPWQDSSPRMGSLYGFTVRGVAVPEPGGLALVALGLGALAARRARGCRVR